MRTLFAFRRTIRTSLIVAATGASALVSAQPQTKAENQCRTIQANAAWQGTGVSVGPGQFVCVGAEGLWSHGIQGLQAITPFYGPEGFGKDEPNTVPEVVSRTGALIGKIGTNAPFLIEKQLCFVPSSAGELLLSMNDVPGAFGNNLGAMHVQIVKWADSRWAPRRITLEPQNCKPR
jgi:hypothetical protein